jgi:hypothetical protein
MGHTRLVSHTISVWWSWCHTTMSYDLTKRTITADRHSRSQHRQMLITHTQVVSSRGPVLRNDSTHSCDDFCRCSIENNAVEVTLPPIITPSPLPLQVKAGGNNRNRLTSLIIINVVINPNDNPSNSNNLLRTLASETLAVTLLALS